MSSVYRWRPAFQADFAARLDWCAKTFGQANHPPAVRINGVSTLTVKPGESIALDATGTTDPDGNCLSFRWSIYPPTPEIEKSVKLRGGETVRTEVEVGSAPNRQHHPHTAHRERRRNSRSHSVRTSVAASQGSSVSIPQGC